MADTIIVSYSELGSARQCAFKHELEYKQRWRAPTTSPALARGTLWHTVLETHYRSLKATQGEGKSDDERLNLACAAVLPLLSDPRSGAQSEDQELIEWMYLGYVQLYGIDAGWQILAVEHAPTVWLRTATGGRSRFQLKMKIDLIIRDLSTSQVWVVDHKSGKDLPKDKELDIDDQFGLYCWGMAQIGRPVFGAIYSAARTQRNKDQTRHPQTLESRFERKRLYRTELELEHIALDAYREARRTWSIPIGEAPRSPNTDTCRWKCSYTEACMMGRKGVDHEAMLRDMGFVQDYTRH